LGEQNMTPEPLEISTRQFEALVEIQIRERKDYPATFSTNEGGDVWLFCTDGNTPREKRVCVERDSSFLRVIARIFREQREQIGKKGGRFHIGLDGVYGHFDDEKGPIVIIKWKSPISPDALREDIKKIVIQKNPVPGRPITADDLRNLMRGRN
jgi:hypothetical protein